RVKSKVREWVNQGLEVTTTALSYLEGKSDYPEVENLSLFDQHLSGLELVKPVRAEALLEFLGERVWEKPDLMRALEQFFDRAGSRITVRRAGSSSSEDQPPKRDLLAWCYEQALGQGHPLPPAFSRAEQALGAELIEPRWIGEASVRNVEDMQLGEEAVRRVLSGCLAPWQLQSLEFAFVSQRTSTEAFYLTLIAQEFRKAFDKIDVVDHLVHQRNLSLGDLARLARAELEIAFQKLVPRLDPTLPVLIFGDHGFRLAPDGSGFTHGGPSTLERLTVVLLLN